MRKGRDSGGESKTGGHEDYIAIDGVVGLRQVDAGNIVHASDTTGLLVVTQLQPIAVIFTFRRTAAGGAEAHAARAELDGGGV